MTQTQRVSTNVAWGYFGRRRAERAEARRERVSARDIVIAQWYIVDALAELPLEGQKAAVQMALAALDIAQGSEE